MTTVTLLLKESNNLEETQVIGIDEDSHIEYENLTEFYDRVLSLKPKNVRYKGISQQALYYQRTIIEN
ncbi:MAG: hypothetical protein ACP5IB_05465 [Thermoplasmata archaeon]